MPARGYPKLHSQTPGVRQRNDRRWERDVARHRFRQPPPAGSVFGAIGTFTWPVTVYRPADFLGNSYEMLDPIRMEHRCYIVFEKELSVFQIMGELVDVRDATLKLRRTYFQIAARELPPVRLHLVDDCYTPASVSLVPYEDDGSSKKVPYGSSTGDELSKKPSSRHILRAIQKCLPKLHYYRGHLELRIRLGTFIAERYKASKGQAYTYTFDEYMDMTGHSGFIGHVTEEFIRNSDRVDILHSLQEADDLLAPLDPMTISLSDVKPVYTAIFTFSDAAGDIELTRTWKEEEGISHTAFDAVSKKWARLDRGTGAANQRLDISLTNLKDGSAWQFDMLALPTVEETRLPEGLAEFPDTLNLDEKAIRKLEPGRPLIVHSRPSLLKKFQQNVSYRFGIIGTDYTLELTRFESFRRPQTTTLTAPRWRLCVYRDEWEKELTQNEDLKIGTSTTWNDDESAWFPSYLDQRDGFELLMDKLQRIARIARPQSAEETFGGMTVG